MSLLSLNLPRNLSHWSASRFTPTRWSSPSPHSFAWRFGGFSSIFFPNLVSIVCNLFLINANCMSLVLFWFWWWFAHLQEMASRKKEDEKLEKIIRGLLKLPGNKRCINCNSLVLLSCSFLILHFYLCCCCCCLFFLFFWVNWDRWMNWIGTLFYGKFPCQTSYLHISTENLTFSIGLCTNVPLFAEIFYRNWFHYPYIGMYSILQRDPWWKVKSKRERGSIGLSGFKKISKTNAFPRNAILISL